MTKHSSPQPEVQVISRYGQLPSEMQKRLNPDALQEYLLDNDLLTNKKVLEKRSITLSRLASNYGKEAVYTLLMAWIQRLNEYLGVKPELRMTSEQLRETVQLLYSDAYCLNMAELSLFFIRIKKGKYGSNYGSVDGLKLNSWLEIFLKDRTIAYASLVQERERKIREQRQIEEVNARKNIAKAIERISEEEENKDNKTK